MTPHIIKKLFPNIAFLSLSYNLLAQGSVVTANEQQRRIDERTGAERLKQENKPQVSLSDSKLINKDLISNSEFPCFIIQKIILKNDFKYDFEWLHKYSSGADGNDDPLNRCLGAKSINVVLKRFQEALLSKGYSTTRVLASSQDLKSGELVFQVVPGIVAAIKLSDTASKTMLRNALPIASGDLLNLRDIEQGLENLKRPSGADADVKIQPSSGVARNQLGASDLMIDYSQKQSIKFNVALDDSGNETTGRYLGNLTATFNNPLRLNDIFYLATNRDLAGRDPGLRGTHTDSIHYSLPLGYWLLALNGSQSRYYMEVFGSAQNYIYSGTSAVADLKLSRLVYRDATHKSTVAIKVFNKNSKNFIEDTEVDVQRRNTSGLDFSWQHKIDSKGKVFDITANYKRGIGAFGALRAPEELFDEGTSRFKIYNLDISGSYPFKVKLNEKQQNLKWTSQLRAQYNETPLVSSDKFTLASRYSVRGFEGVGNLSANKGWFSKNEIHYTLKEGHDFYVGYDYGQILGVESEMQGGNTLSGATIGFKGAIKSFNYDFFASKALVKPAFFAKNKNNYGFNMSISF